MKKWLIVLLPWLLVETVALAQTTPLLPWHLIGGGGGRVTHARFSVESVAGQPVTGVASHDSYTLYTGLWPLDLVAVQRLYLPLVQRR